MPGLLNPDLGRKARGIFRIVLVGGDEEFGGAVQTFQAQGKQHMVARRLHGKMDWLGLEIRGQVEAEAKVWIAVSGSPEPRDFGILHGLGLCRCNGAEGAEAGEEGNNVSRPTLKVRPAELDSGTIEFSGKSKHPA